MGMLEEWRIHPRRCAHIEIIFCALSMMIPHTPKDVCKIIISFMEVLRWCHQRVQQLFPLELVQYFCVRRL
jgi:hypothetical protein